MRLISLNLTNFQGVSSFSLAPDGSDITVMGDNATGKTTLANAFSWLLFGKDSLGQANFEIKPLNPDGSVQHGLTTEVEAVLLNGTNQQITLKKTYSEKYTKRRGAATAELTGHDINHFVDGVPAKSGEFQASVSRLCDESLFKLLTNPRYFNEQLHWQKRREILLAICGDVSDQDVIDGDQALTELPGILNGRKMEDHRKVLDAQRKEINKHLQEIPARIDEANRSKVVVAESHRDVAMKMSLLIDNISDKQAQLSRVQSGGELAEKRKALVEIESKLLDLDNQERKARQEAFADKEARIATIKHEAAECNIEIDSAKRLQEKDAAELNQLNQELARLRGEFERENSKQFEHTTTNTCPTCGQSLPAEQIQSAREKALSDFNSAKAEKLRSINMTGKRLTAGKATLTAQVAERQRLILNEEAILEKLQNKIDEASIMAAEFLPNPEREKLAAVKAVLIEAIAQIDASPDTAANDLDFAILALEQEKQTLQAKLAAFDTNRKAEARMTDLKKQERELARDYEDTERQLHLCDLFVRNKVGMLTVKINSKFDLAQWKLFVEQINSGLAECCEVTVNGVPYTSLNNGARTNVGLDVINTLSRYHGVSAPIFCDNAEAVTDLLHTDAQQIRLMVSADHKTLTIKGA
jgi:hypothetical protein